MLTLETLVGALSSCCLLGKELARDAELEHPGLRYTDEVGTGLWNETLCFETQPLFVNILSTKFWKPSLVSKKKDVPNGSRITGRLWIKGKTAYQEVLKPAECDSDATVLLTQTDAFHLGLGHELIHSMARNGGLAGKSLTCLDALPLVSFLSAIPAAYLLCHNDMRFLIYMLPAIFILCVYAILVPSTDRHGWHERRGTILSYDREELWQKLAPVFYSQDLQERQIGLTTL